MKNKLYVGLLLVLLIVTIVLRVRSCQNELAAINWKARYDTAMYQVRELRNQAGRQVLEQKVAMFADAAALEQASAKAFNLKAKDERKIREVQAFVQVEQAVVVTNDSAAIVPTGMEEDSTTVASLKMFELKQFLKKDGVNVRI